MTAILNQRIKRLRDFTLGGDQVLDELALKYNVAVLTANPFENNQVTPAVPALRQGNHIGKLVARESEAHLFKTLRLTQ